MIPLGIARILRSTATGAGSVAGTSGVDQGLAYDLVSEMDKRVGRTGLILAGCRQSPRAALRLVAGA